MGWNAAKPSSVSPCWHSGSLRYYCHQENKHSGIINQCKMKQRGPAQLIWNWFNDSPVNTHLPSRKQESRLISTDMPLSAPCIWQSHLDLAWFANIKKKNKTKNLMGFLKLWGKVTDGGKVGDRNDNLAVACCFWAYKILAFLRKETPGHASKWF